MLNKLKYYFFRARLLLYQRTSSIISLAVIPFTFISTDQASYDDGMIRALQELLGEKGGFGTWSREELLAKAKECLHETNSEIDEDTGNLHITVELKEEIKDEK